MWQKNWLEILALISDVEERWNFYYQFKNTKHATNRQIMKLIDIQVDRQEYRLIERLSETKQDRITVDRQRLDKSQMIYIMI